MSIRLRIKSPDSFSISCPFLTPNFVIQKFINSNLNWIFNHSNEHHIHPNIKNLTSLSILDQNYQLIINKTNKDSVIFFEKDRIIHLNSNSDHEIHLKKILESRLRRVALNLIKEEIKNIGFSFSFNRITVRNQCSRFGSCSSRGNLNFNWQIIFFPPDKFHHILLHELTHLEIKNHSKKFWDQLTIYDSNCKINNFWLKKEGTKCFLF